jgi:hypothetical protein
MSKINNTAISNWVSSKNFWKKANQKWYKHLDKKITIRDFDWKRISSWKKIDFSQAYIRYKEAISPLLEFLDEVFRQENISSHKFLPFLLIQKPKWKISWKKEKRNQKWKRYVDEVKTRPIMYASHSDSLIYAFYGYLWGNLYEKQIWVLWLNNVALAYRRILCDENGRWKNNIN